ncbi:MAG TPA: Clp protease N-terminal domain-containing protein [Acidimicrobiales bacterium]|nr:Clp protease N-terminal domain-containing protein [Acidimicrobiales bacterium]
MAAPVSLDQLISTVRSAAPDEPLAQLEAASRLRDEVGELTDAVLGHFVDQARRAGCSWSQIGDALGVSKQAAQQKHTGRSLPMDRLTDRTRLAIDRASNEARRLQHTYVGTEHLLLGLLAVPEGLAAKVLVEAGITATSIEAHVLALVGRGPGSTEAAAPLPHTPRAARCLIGMLEVALGMGHNYLGTEHLLLSLYREPDGIAARFLDANGLPEAQARLRITQLLLEIAGGRAPA